MTAWNNAWSAKRDRRAPVLYADGVQYYDAAAIDTVITKSDMDAMNGPRLVEVLRLTLESLRLRRWPLRRHAGQDRAAGRAGDLPWQPAVSVLRSDDKIVWECDYYGGEPAGPGGRRPCCHPIRRGRAGSPAAKTAIAEATATMANGVGLQRQGAEGLPLLCRAGQVRRRRQPQEGVMTRAGWPPTWPPAPRTEYLPG